VEAYNYNTLAPGQRSEILSVHACDVPFFDKRPVKVSTSPTSISISWNEPRDNGGCHIQGYSVHIDDGEGGAFLEANEDNDPNVRLNPSLNHLEITRLTNVNIGKTY
jgi:hypothetical protein